MHKNIKHLVTGGILKESDGDIWVWNTQEINLCSPASNSKASVIFTLDGIKNMEIYISPEQARIAELEQQLASTQAEIQKLLAPKSNRTYNRLSTNEIREIEEILMSDKVLDRNLILSTYETSQPVLSRIRTGKHTKSSEKYKTFLLKQNLRE